MGSNNILVVGLIGCVLLTAGIALIAGAARHHTASIGGRIVAIVAGMMLMSASFWTMTTAQPQIGTPALYGVVAVLSLVVGSTIGYLTGRTTRPRA